VVRTQDWLTPRAEYALGELLRLLDVPAERAADVASELPPPGDGDWEDPRPDPARLRPPRRLERFDVLYATYACLTAPWERLDPADEVGCPLAAGGWLARYGLLRRPLVHRYAELVADALGVEPRRDERVVVTHDVDDNFEHLFGVRARLELLRREPGLRRAAGLARRVATPRRNDPNDRFEPWWPGHRPTYFVAARGILDGGDRRDVTYDVRHPEVRETLRRALAQGAEVGVHFSIAAGDDPAALRGERERLEAVVGGPVGSSRHHWWAVPSGPVHARAGIAVDLSLGFNDGIGFRRGIARPFRPYDPSTGRAASVWALPTLAMDAAVTGAADLHSLWSTVRSVGGALVLDWHVHAANPRVMPGAAETLRAVVEAAMADGAVVATPLEVPC
jgi:hypothetical protein